MLPGAPLTYPHIDTHTHIRTHHQSTHPKIGNLVSAHAPAQLVYFLSDIVILSGPLIIVYSFIPFDGSWSKEWLTAGVRPRLDNWAAVRQHSASIPCLRRCAWIHPYIRLLAEATTRHVALTVLRAGNATWRCSLYINNDTSE